MIKTRNEVKQQVLDFWINDTKTRRKAWRLSLQPWIGELKYWFDDENMPVEWDFNRKLWHFFKGTTAIPLCPISNLPRQFAGSGKLDLITELPSFASGYTTYANAKISQSEIPKLARKTCIDKYGVDNPFKSDKVKTKIKETIKNEYGVEFISQSQSIKDQKEKTMMDKYGRPHNFAAHKDFMVAKYGVRHSAHLPQVAEILCNNRFKVRHKFILPSGKILELQGYERFGIAELLKEFEEDEIYHAKGDMPAILYNFKGKSHRYYPDFYIPKANLVIEVKSEYTYESDLEKNKAKFTAAKAKGLTHRLQIFDRYGYLKPSLGE
jgi:hypothetical protein